MTTRILSGATWVVLCFHLHKIKRISLAHAHITAHAKWLRQKSEKSSIDVGYSTMQIVTGEFSFASHPARWQADTTYGISCWNAATPTRHLYLRKNSCRFPAICCEIACTVLTIRVCVRAMGPANQTRRTRAPLPPQTPPRRKFWQIESLLKVHSGCFSINFTIWMKVSRRKGQLYVRSSKPGCSLCRAITVTRDYSVAINPCM